MTTAIPDGYYATPNPTNPATMTYWRTRNGRLTPWPTRARYAPTLLKRDVPPDLHGPDRQAWVRNWYAQHTTPWHQAIRDALTTDPDRCRARFTALTTRCTECGRALTDKKSKLLGVGPDCRRSLGLDDEVLAATVTPLIAAAHGRQTATQEP